MKLGQICLISSLLLATGIHVDAAKSGRPNIVLFIADDLSIDDCAVYGNEEIATPNIDALAEEGLTFDRAYVASPSCSPSRAALLTGNYGVRTGGMLNHQSVRADVRTWPAYFQDLGYEVVAIGKVSHYAQVTSYGFDYAGYYKFHQDECVEEAKAWLARRNSARPLCLIVGTNWPHTPWPQEMDRAPESVRLSSKLADTPETRIARSRYIAAVGKADHDLGVMRAAVQRHLPADTVFVFTSDHGAPFPFSKWTLYEDGVKVPLIVAGAGRIPVGQRTSAMVSWLDLMPTLLEVAGADPESVAPAIDGRSFFDVFADATTEHRRRLFTAHSGDGSLNFYPSRSVRIGRWKYIRNLDASLEFHSHIDLKPEGMGYWPSWERAAAEDPKIAGLVERYWRRPPEELYDLENDPDELHNLANDPSHRDRLATLRGEIDSWMESVGDRGMQTERDNLRNFQKSL